MTGIWKCSHLGSGREPWGNENMNLRKALLAPSPACFKIALCVIYFCKANVRVLPLFSVAGADNCLYVIDSCNGLWSISGNLPLEISDSAPISAPFVKVEKMQPQGPTLMVTGKFGNVTQTSPYHQAQESRSKYNKYNLSFSLESFKPVSLFEASA